MTDFLLDQWRRPPHSLPAPPTPGSEEDAGLALYLCYELHYRGLEGVDAEWEWEPTALAARRTLERELEARLRAATGAAGAVTPDEVVPALRELARAGDGPSLSGWMLERGTLDQLRELAIHRSAYQLKEADPHTWGLPRLTG